MVRVNGANLRNSAKFHLIRIKYLNRCFVFMWRISFARFTYITTASKTIVAAYHQPSTINTLAPILLRVCSIFATSVMAGVHSAFTEYIQRPHWKPTGKLLSRNLPNHFIFHWTWFSFQHPLLKRMTNCFHSRPPTTIRFTHGMRQWRLAMSFPAKLWQNWVLKTHIVSQT